METLAAGLTSRARGWYRLPRMSIPADASDADLARAIAARTPESAEPAEGELYRRLAPRVRLYGLRHLRDEDAARDLTQQVMLLTIEKLRNGSIRDTDHIASFVLGVSRTVAMDLQRRERRREKLRQTFLDARAFEAPVAAATLDIDRLDACLARLPQRERLVVLLTFYGDKTATEVGKELALTNGHVRVIRHRAIEQLRACVMAREAIP